MSLATVKSSLILRQVAEEQLGKLKVQVRAPSCDQDLCNKLQGRAVSAVSNSLQATLVGSVMLLLFLKSLNIAMCCSDCIWQLLQLKMYTSHKQLHLTSPAVASVLSSVVMYWSIYAVPFCMVSQVLTASISRRPDVLVFLCCELQHLSCRCKPYE